MHMLKFIEDTTVGTADAECGVKPYPNVVVVSGVVLNMLLQGILLFSFFFLGGVLAYLA